MASQSGSSDFLNHSHHHITAQAISLQTISTIVLALRLYCRISRKWGKPGWDDLFISIGWLFGTALTGVIILGTDRYGYGHHAHEIPLDVYPDAIFAGWLASALFFPSTGCTKLSILMFYRKLLGNCQHRTSRWITWATMAFVIIYTLLFVFLPFATCQPIDARWNKLDPSWKKPYQCRDLAGAAPASCALSAFTDLWIILMPLPWVLQLKLPRRQKIGLMMLFSVGLSCVATGLARTIYMEKLIRNLSDFTWHGAYVLIWTLYECHLAFFCACCPALRGMAVTCCANHLNVERSWFSKSQKSGHNPPLHFSTAEEHMIKNSPSFTETHEVCLGVDRNIAVAYQTDVESTNGSKKTAFPRRTDDVPRPDSQTLPEVEEADYMVKVKSVPNTKSKTRQKTQSPGNLPRPPSEVLVRTPVPPENRDATGISRPTTPRWAQPTKQEILEKNKTISEAEKDGEKWWRMWNQE